MQFIEKTRKTAKIRQKLLDHYNLSHDTEIRLADIGTWQVIMPCTSCDGFGFVNVENCDDLTRCKVCKDNLVYSTPGISGKRTKYHYTTKTGRIIRHPSAYSKRGWSSMVYKSSQYFTLTVGLRWIAHSQAISQRDVIKSGIAGIVYEVTDSPTV